MRLLRGMVALSVVGTLFTAAPALAGKKVTIKGGGWGHGIGMSQYGTYGRAKNGKSAEEILEHYYSGAQVTQKNMPATIRVGLLQGRSSITVSSVALGDGGGRLLFEVGGEKLAAGPSGVTWRVEPSSTGGVRLYKNGEQVKRDGKTVFGGPSNPLVMEFEKFNSQVTVDSKSYKYALGHMEFAAYDSGSCGGACLRLVVVLSMQKYLYGLGEVPASWPGAALRTQAIAGRTYAFEKITRLGQHRDPCDCAVYDSTIDQAYTGDSKRTGSGEYWDDWKGAVDDTKAQVVLHSGDPIQALYSSSSGGYTENNENVWGGTPLPYLRGVRDGPDATSANPNHDWTVTMSWSEFSNKLNAAFGTGDLKNFEIVKPLGVSGRVTVVKSATEGGARIAGSKKTERVSGWSLRSALALKDTLFKVDIDFETGEKFTPRYNKLDGAPGEPRGETYWIPRRSQKRLGRAQDFQVGRMTWVKKEDRVLWQYGPVLAKYDALRREKSGLGLPSSDIWGRDDYKGASYANGIIVWSESTGAKQVQGTFAVAYRKNDGVRGPLGLPIKKREARKELPGGGRRQRFASGTLYLNPDTGNVLALWGPLDARYRRMGEASSNCGYPTSGASASDSEVSAEFQHGTMLWKQSEGVTVNCG